MKIYYDSLQEGLWFRNLHPRLAHATLLPFPNAAQLTGDLALALAYDRPDIILTNETDQPLLILERTIEVPSGHNVGQRFARLVGAAKLNVPAVYFGPFKAFKHGGKTQGPRYMNLRLFQSIQRLKALENTSITILNWIVDGACEIIQTAAKDVHIIEYLTIFFNYFDVNGLNGITQHINHSQFEIDRAAERTAFTLADVKRPEQYDVPPPSVSIGPNDAVLAGIEINGLAFEETVVYRIGMTYIRSDPYTGTALLYKYLYCGGLPSTERNMILHFPQISIEMWQLVRAGGGRKDERLFRAVADGIIFSDGYMPHAEL